MSVSHVYPEFERDDLGVEVPFCPVDTAGYRTAAQLVASFKQAGEQLSVFRAAEFDGDLTVNPLYAFYSDPSDRDKALYEALERTRKSKEEYLNLRKKALDKRKQMREDEIVRIAERVQRRRDAASRSEVFSKETEQTVSE